ncbi:translocation/assembly module TamB domain-containing protein [Blochmannia endosymbiont of Camponotus modoc]|uniref:autotransporter assembly complex protein TamB n=1 Tax=Blochmannia endosymbiont of Camponotus modoc TaxID=2945587 RepID=UPI002024B25C|nr:translocation/assembly module TamB domain-containing protein [Blochmannia endosymbiont of Camponotus modoc]URJ29344.1 translocation/assembly module TamB domain-containing protein [Blochmannia endosymbiont of Camponotus modoc]
MIFIKKICVIFLLWISIVCGFFVFLLGTNIGAYLTFTGITYCIPGLEFDSVSGTWGNFNITHVVYETSIGVFNVDKCDVFLNLKDIWNKKIYINHLFLEDVCIKIKKNDATNKLDKKYEGIKIDNTFSIPFPVILKNIVLNNTCIHLNNITFEVTKLDTELTFQDNLLTILPVNIKGAVLNIPDVNTLNITTNAIDIYKYSNNQRNIKYLLKSLSSKLLIILPSFNLPINIILKDITGENFYIFDNNNSCIINYFYLQTYLYNQTANIKLNLKCPYGYLNAIGSIIFKEYYPINISLNYTKYHFDTSSNSTNIKKKDVSKIKLVIVGELYNEIRLCCDFLGVISTVHVLLKTKIIQFGTPITISIVGRKIPLSFLGKNDYLIEELDISVNGEIRNYSIQITSKLSSAQFSSLVHIVMSAQGDVNSCSISKLRMTALEEYLDIQGMVNWVGDIISWNSMCVLNKINIFQKWLKCPINLSGNINMQGHVCSDAWDITISDLNLNGSIENNSISCIGILYNNSTGIWKIPALLIKWGPNVLKIQEDLKRDSIFNIVFAAPDCNVLIPGLNGSVYGKFKLYSPVKYSPRLLLNINACSLYWHDKNINFDKIMINGDICYDTVIQSKIFFQANQIKCGILSLRKLIMQGQGNIKEHYLDLVAYGDMLSGQVKLFGNLDLFHKTWNSKINKTNIVTSIGTWKLMQDIVLTYQYLTRKVILNSHYWEVVDCTIPISHVLKENILNKVNDAFKNLNVVSLKILLPRLMNIHTVRIYCTDCYWILGTLLPKGIISFSGNQCNIKSAIEESEIFPITINNITAKIVLTQTTSYCKWFMNIGDDDQIHGLFKITKLHNTSKLVGNVYVKNVSLVSFFNSLISLQEPINGLLNLNLYFDGYKHHIKIYGTGQLKNFNFNKPDTLFFVKNGQCFIKFFGDHAVLNGIIDTDYGYRLHLNGNIMNFDSINNIHAFFKIRGNQINFCMSPEIKMKISPDFTCTITSKKIHIEGNVEIPWAHIEVKEYSKNITNISSEEILLDDNFQLILNNSKNLFISFSANINVCLGNDVNFNGLGFRTKLRGNLEIEYNKNHLALTGHIDIPSGCFQAYGQNLIIRKGQLLFSGAINQPYIDIEAICDPSSIKEGSIVGIRITGTFSQPKIEIFSDSLSLSPQEITSYLLGGNKNVIPLNTDTNIVTSLLIGATVRNSEKFVNKIGKIFGVQDLTLNTQDIGTAPLVALSGYIAPGLQIKYGIGIFDLLTTITVRYCLCSQLYLEVTSGSNQQAVDILYKLDF